ncbi:iron-containing redox enzyme family protein [Sorangium sp. So ce1014]|uniref:iron-containing redox enzyme family protein n=1 Tax=Sorangium sp. So ce1014 TaxID=3133326 RepID=UPI003F5EA319
MTEQERLYRFNHPLTPGDAAPHRAAAALRFEEAWMARCIAGIEQEQGDVRAGTLEGFRAALDRRLSEARATPSEGARFVAEDASREQFRAIVREYALDGLTEAQAMFAVMPRLDPESLPPVMRILIDEFGCGNPARVHSTLYRNLLAELELPTALEGYLQEDRVEAAFSLVNLYHWLTKRAPTVDAYLGALAYTEGAIPWSFRCFVAACERLGIQNHAYFSEHVHIDAYHARDALLALSRRHRAHGVDFHAAWLGAELARCVGDEAFERIVRRAMGAKDVFRIEARGKRYCVVKACPHRGGDLSKGVVRRDGKAITCPLHGATFALPSGRRLGGPECSDLEVTEDGAGPEDRRPA